MTRRTQRLVSQRVDEVRRLVTTRGVPASVKAPCRAVDAALRGGPNVLLGALLTAAIGYARAAAAFDLRSHRDRAGLSRRDLARRCGRTEGYVARVERGKTRVDVTFMGRAIRTIRSCQRTKEGGAR
jgi:hypothetical protein